VEAIALGAIGLKEEALSGNIASPCGGWKTVSCACPLIADPAAEKIKTNVDTVSVHILNQL
jgi:hypothetical protein